MKRTGPPKRKKGLNADPEKVKAFVDRGRQALGRSSGALRRSEGLKRGKPRENPSRPPTGAEGVLRDAVWELDGGRCCGCRTRVPRHADRRVWQAHHGIPKQRLKAYAREYARKERLARGTATTVAAALIGSPDSCMLLCTECHELHEGGSRRVPFRKVPDRVKRFAVDLGPWAEDVLVLRHPET